MRKPVCFDTEKSMYLHSLFSGNDVHFKNYDSDTCLIQVFKTFASLCS